MCTATAFPRTDLNVTLDGVTIKPALALGGWVAFKPMHGGAMVMGDLVLLETEINPVMTKMIAERAGDHGDPQPRAARLARDLLHACRRARRCRETRDGDPGCARREQDADAGPGRRLSASGRSTSTPRRSTRSSASKDRPTAASTNWPCRAGIPSPKAACSYASGPDGREHRDRLSADRRRQGGDHRRLRADRDRGQSGHQGAEARNGIEITAIHSHMLTEQPRLIFMHFWANDDAIKLARGLRAAIDKTASKITEFELERRQQRRRSETARSRAIEREFWM